MICNMFSVVRWPGHKVNRDNVCHSSLPQLLFLRIRMVMIAVVLLTMRTGPQTPLLVPAAESNRDV